jgi:hypothetical protein
MLLIGSGAADVTVTFGIARHQKRRKILLTTRHSI